MKRFATLFCMLLLLPVIVSAGEKVTATGVSFFEEGRVAIAREKALDEAKRAAIEQAVGTRIESRTVIENFQVSRDQVFSHATGYLKNMEIVSEQKTDLGTYEVEIRAEVEIAALVNDLDRFKKILGWQKNPRVSILVDPDLDKAYVPVARKTASRLGRRLKSEGFRVFDAATADTSGMGLILRLGLEIASSESSYQGVNLTLHEISLRTDVLRPGQGEILATASAVKSLPGSNKLKVLDKGAKQCVDSVWKNLRRQLTKTWEKELYSQRQIDLVVQNITSHAEAEEVGAILKSDASGMVDVQLPVLKRKKPNSAFSTMAGLSIWSPNCRWNISVASILTLPWRASRGTGSSSQPTKKNNFQYTAYFSSLNRSRFNSGGQHEKQGILLRRADDYHGSLHCRLYRRQKAV